MKLNNLTPQKLTPIKSEPHQQEDEESADFPKREPSTAMTITKSRDSDSD